MKRIIILIGAILLGIVFIFSQALSKAIKYDSKSQSQNIMNQDFTIQDIVGIGNVISVLDLPEGFEVKIDNPIMEELKMEINLTEEQILLFKVIVEMEVEREFLGKQIGQFEIWKGTRGLTGQDIKQKAILEKQQSNLGIDITKKLSELKKSMNNEVFKLVHWINENRYLVDRVNKAYLKARRSSNDPLQAQENFIVELRNIEDELFADSRFNELLDTHRKQSVDYLKHKFNLTPQQEKTVLEILGQYQKKIIALRLRLFAQSRNSNLLSYKQTISQILYEKNVKNNALKKILTR